MLRFCISEWGECNGLGILASPKVSHLQFECPCHDRHDTEGQGVLDFDQDCGSDHYDFVDRGESVKYLWLRVKPLNQCPIGLCVNSELSHQCAHAL